MCIKGNLRNLVKKKKKYKKKMKHKNKDKKEKEIKKMQNKILIIK